MKEDKKEEMRGGERGRATDVETRREAERRRQKWSERGEEGEERWIIHSFCHTIVYFFILSDINFVVYSLVYICFLFIHSIMFSFYHSLIGSCN